MSTVRKLDGYVYVVIKSDWYDYEDTRPADTVLLGTKSEHTANNIVDEKKEKFLKENKDPSYNCEFRLEKIPVLKE